MADGMLALSWNNHSTTFCHMLSQIRLKDRYTDATVACEGKFYPVHRIVLSTCSKYFEEMFELTSAGKHPIVLLQDVRRYELEALLSYMYAGVVSVAQKDLSRLIKIAELLQIKGLAVPDELPSEKKSVSNQSERTNSGHHKSSHVLDSSDGRTSPSRKRRRREERAVSPQVIPSSVSSSKSQYSHDEDDDIQEIRDTINKDQEENMLLGPVEETSRTLPSGEGSRHPPASADEANVHQQTSQESSGRTVKDGSDELVWVKEEVLDDPVESRDDSIKEELPVYGSLSTAGDESGPLEESEEYSQTSHGQLPHPLSEPVAEALAGPSGIHEWLSGGDMAAGLPSVDNYGGEGSPPTSDHPQSQQLEGAICSSRSSFSSSFSSGLQVHQCPYCSYSTPREGHYVDHIRTHTGEKPFGCHHCPARFKQKGQLNRHIRTHTGERPYRCAICSQDFARKDNLNSHILSHKR